MIRLLFTSLLGDDITRGITMADRSANSYCPFVCIVVDSASAYGRAVMRGAMRHANVKRRWAIHVDLRHTISSEEEFPRCDGAILAGCAPPVFDYARRRAAHTIACSGSMDPRIMPVVSLDDKAAGAMVAQHLIDCRLEHFAFYGNATVYNVAANRMQGFGSRLEAQGLTCVKCPVLLPNGIPWLNHSHRPQVIEWLHKLPKPIGIMAVDDTVANDLADTCRTAGIRVPAEVVIIGVDNDDLLCDTAWPPLTSIEVDYSRMGYHAAKLLDRMMAGEVLTEEERCMRLPPLRVVERQSTSILAVDDPYLGDAVRYIRRHACDPCKVPDVLRHVPVTRRWLERQFVAKLGRTPNEEIIHVRISTAQQLLLQQNLTVAEVAHQCGYTAVENFTRTFRKVTGTSPGAFRKTALRSCANSHPTHRARIIAK